MQGLQIGSRRFSRKAFSLCRVSPSELRTSLTLNVALAPVIMADELHLDTKDVDVVVLGTGLTECLVSAFVFEFLPFCPLCFRQWAPF